MAGGLIARRRAVDITHQCHSRILHSDNPPHEGAICRLLFSKPRQALILLTQVKRETETVSNMHMANILILPSDNKKSLSFLFLSLEESTRVQRSRRKYVRYAVAFLLEALE